MQIQDQKFFSDQVGSPTVDYDGHQSIDNGVTTTLPRRVKKTEQSPESAALHDSAVNNRILKVTKNSRNSNTWKKRSDVHEEYSKMSVQSDNYGTSAPLDSMSIKDESQIVSKKDSNFIE